jgi:hypothetical protein
VRAEYHCANIGEFSIRLSGSIGDANGLISELSFERYIKPVASNKSSKAAAILE